MASGLYIDEKRDFHIVRWLIVLGILLTVAAASYYAYRWYTTGEKPPVVPVPSKAYAETVIDEKPLTKKQIDTYKVPSTHPRYISIPALNISKARVATVGLLKNNELDTPLHIDDTGWYTESAFPGQGFGVVLIDGHNGGVSRNGIFAELGNLKNNDKIIIERGDGKKISYSVVENKTMSLQEANKTGMNRVLQPFDPDKEGLGLITCAGDWVPRDRVYST
ncbi:sortase, partial [Candidatus Saccharibacteria bacterium]|nr:sortase [Candidatus Saccharibacteria bacterium]